MGLDTWLGGGVSHNFCHNDLIAAIQTSTLFLWHTDIGANSLNLNLFIFAYYLGVIRNKYIS